MIKKYRPSLTKFVSLSLLARLVVGKGLFARYSNQQCIAIAIHLLKAVGRVWAGRGKHV